MVVCRALLPVVVLVAALLSGAPVRSDEGSIELRVVGSGTLRALVESWGTRLGEGRPGIRVEVESGGSSAGPGALLQGRAQIASMSREMLPAEVEAFRRVRGVEPLAIKVAIDAVAVFVHPANPMGSLSLAQLDAIYSAERRCDGAAEAVRTWGQVGAGGPWAEQAIMAYGHRARSGTRMVFRRVALCGGPFHDDVHEHPSAGSAAHAVAEVREAIGYGSWSQRREDVKVLALSPAEGRPAVPLALATVAAGTYPLSRPLLLYLDPTREGPEAELARELVRHALSVEGQRQVGGAGFLPIPASQAKREAEQLR